MQADEQMQMAVIGRAIPARAQWQGARLTGLQRNCFWLYIFPLALDVRGETSGGALQMFLFALSTAGFIVFAIASKWRSTRNASKLRRVCWLWGAYLGSTVLVAGIAHVSLVDYSRNILPFFLMGESLLFGLVILRTAGGVRLIVDALMACGVASTVWTFLYIRNIRHLPVDVARHMLVSPFAVPLLVMSVGALILLGRRAGFLAVIALPLSAAAIFLSVTRSYLLAALVGFISCVLVFRRCKGPALRRARRAQIGRWFAATIGMAVLVAIGSAASGQFSRSWSNRMSLLGAEDPTSLSRIAEASGEWQAMQASARHLLLGSGVGSPHQWDVRFVIAVPDFANSEALDPTHDITSVGHISWVYQFYASGVLLGWVLPYVQLVALRHGFGANRRVESYIGAMAFTAVSVVLLTGNLLGSRNGGALIGLFVAICLADSAVRKTLPRRCVQPRMKLDPLTA